MVLVSSTSGPRPKQYVSIRYRSEEDEEDSVYSNYDEKKLYIQEEGVGSKGGVQGGYRQQKQCES
jgi:hypothetical protein